LLKYEDEEVFMYGMFLRHLTDEIIVEVLQLYERVVGGYAFLREIDGKVYSFQLTLKQVQEGLRKSNVVERRFGSRLSMHSKLYLFEKYLIGDRVIYFDFYPNLDGYEKQAGELARSFEKEVDDFLVKNKLAVTF
jgi:hypothetical protein